MQYQKRLFSLKKSFESNMEGFVLNYIYAD